LVDLGTEARRVVDAARERGVTLRVLGGLAVKLHCPSAEHRGLARGYGDLDFCGRRQESGQVKQVFADLGYAGQQRFNALYGFKRLMFDDPGRNIHVDVFLDVFQMCHRLDLGERLARAPLTLPLADLLLTKLQVVQLNEKDVQDIYALLLDHPLAEDDDAEAINVGRVVEVCADDWGWYRTVSQTLASCRELAPRYLEGEALRLASDRLAELAERIAAAPKSLRWKLRARVGERVRWYELPEEPNREV
jgi:hypothetical protein